MTYRIRRAREAEYPLLPAVERSAARLFATTDMPEIAEGQTSDLAFIEAVARAGAIFVAADEDDRPAGFAFVGFLDRALHLYELSVAENHGRRGLGRRLVADACAFAKAESVDAMTLSTFRDIPWNGPFYEKLGFRFLGKNEWTPALLLLHHREADLGLPVARRGFMRKDLT